MSYKKIIVTHTQSIKIQKLLKADDGKRPIQELIDDIKNEGQVEDWVAERFAKAWRYNHRNDDDNEKTEQAPNQANAEPSNSGGEQVYYVMSKFPKKAEGKDPSAGTGKVAQIIRLAEKGLSTQQIIEQGFNKSTVYRQVSEWRQRKKKLAKA